MYLINYFYGWPLILLEDNNLLLMGIKDAVIFSIYTLMSCWPKELLN